MTNTVTFPNSNTYNDGVTPPGNLDNGGHVVNFIPLISDTILLAAQVTTNAATVAADKAIVAADKATVQSTASGVSLTTTSTSSVLIGTGTKTFTLAAAINVQIGQYFKVTDQADSANYVFGNVTAWNSGTRVIEINVTVVGGTGTKSSWYASVSGERGAAGPTGGGTGDMLAAQNLNDLANKTTSRANLGVAIGTDVQAYNANTVFANVSNTFVSPQVFSDQLVTRAAFRDCSERAYSAGNISGAVTLDYTNGHYQYATVTGNITSVTVNNWPPSGDLGWLQIELTQDATGGHTIALGAAYKTPGGSGLSFSSAANAEDILMLRTRNAGTKIYADLGKDYK
jgi:hypothetical protein